MTGALAGLRVIEVCNYVAGPHAGMIMADLGAEVIKVEPPDGEFSRSAAPVGAKGESLYFITCNRNKKSVVLDLKKPEGREIFRGLVKRSDVVLDNLRPGAMAKLGLDYATLSQINPRIISCSISGYGQTGPYRDRPGFDYLLQGYSGLADMIADEGGPPMTTRVSAIDLLGGIHGALGILAAVAARERTGEGQFVDIGLLNCAVSLFSYHVAGYFGTGHFPRRMPGSAHPYLVPSQIFKTKDSYMLVLTPQNAFFDKLCQIIGLPELPHDPRYANPRARSEHREELVALLQERLLTRTTAEWLEEMLAAEITVAPVNSVEEAMRDPQVLARHAIVEYEHPVEGNVTVVGNPVQMSGNPEVFRPAPALGEHTQETLADLLGYTNAEIEQLQAAGVCRLSSTAAVPT